MADQENPFSKKFGLNVDNGENYPGLLGRPLTKKQQGDADVLQTCLFLLFDHFGLDIANPKSMGLLAMRLMLRHVPGFQRTKISGRRPTVNTPGARDDRERLLARVKEIQAKNPSVSVTAACKTLASRPDDRIPERFREKTAATLRAAVTLARKEQLEAQPHREALAKAIANALTGPPKHEEARRTAPAGLYGLTDDLSGAKKEPKE